MSLELFFEVEDSRLKLYCRKDLGTEDNYLHPIGATYHAGDDVQESVETVLKMMDYGKVDYTLTEIVMGRSFESSL
tara:strand:+ start:621 stop:848 length:228 start_codon:yes stop_codon:yes gene_type:complete